MPTSVTHAVSSTRVAAVAASLLMFSMFASQPARAPAQTTTFTYQGQLTDAGTAANGTYDLQFALFGSEAGFSNLTTDSNSFFGRSAGRSNIGSQNSFFGESAGERNTTGIRNCLFGTGAGQSGNGANNSSFGWHAGAGNSGSGNCRVLARQQRPDPVDRAQRGQGAAAGD